MFSMSRNSGRLKTYSRPPAWPVEVPPGRGPGELKSTSSSGAGTERRRSIMSSNTEKMAVFTPIPTASETTAATVTTGRLASDRAAYRHVKPDVFRQSQHSSAVHRSLPSIRIWRSRSGQHESCQRATRRTFGRSPSASHANAVNVRNWDGLRSNVNTVPRLNVLWGDPSARVR